MLLVSTLNSALSLRVRSLFVWSIFPGLAEKAIGVILLTADEVVNIDFTEFSKAADYFTDDLPCKSVLSMEFMRWKKQCVDMEEKQRPSSLAETLWVCDKDLYPNIHKMLTIAVTRPVTSSEYERSFSGLRRLNTYLRATQTAERLDSLALIHIHRSHQYDMEELIDRFSRMHPRRMELTNVLHEGA